MDLSVHHLLHVLVFMSLILPAWTYSKKARSVQVQYEGAWASIDLVTASLQRSVEELCAQVHCDVPSTISDIDTWYDNLAHEAIEGAYLALVGQYNSLETPEQIADWRAQTIDPSVTTNHYDTQIESKNLLNGIFRPRISCTDSANTDKTCKFAALLRTYRIHTPINMEQLTFAQWGYLFELSDELFNLQLYDQAEAWSYYLVHNLIGTAPSTTTTTTTTTSTTTTTTFAMTSLSTYQHILLTRGSLLLSEIHRLKGQLPLATYHSMRAIRSYNILTTLSTTQNVPYFRPQPNLALISRLRILLTIPPTPPDYAEALHFRREMIADLGVFVQDILAHNLTLSLQDLSSHISAMPFNMAHQGLNDAQLQQMLYTVLTTLCPELVYTAPHLLSGGDSDSGGGGGIGGGDSGGGSGGGDDSGTVSGNDNSGDSASTSSTKTKPCTHTTPTGVCIHRTLRVGFLSTNFFDHSIGRILSNLLIVLPHQVVLHNGQYYKLDLYVFTIDRRLPSDARITVHTSTTDTTDNTYSIHVEHDTSTLPHIHHDAVSRIIHDYLPNRSIRLPDNIHTVRSVLAAAGLDMLVFSDVGMDFSSYQVAFGRFAPYQAAWWGHPITPSLPSIDYFVSLHEEVRSAHTHYSEQVVRMQYINTVPLAVPYNTRLARLERFDRNSDDGGGNTLTELTASEQEAVSDRQTLTLLNLHNANIVMVLGRLFKLHPAFDELLVSLLFELYSHDSGRDSSSDGNISSNTYIVLIAESVYELNNIILTRLMAAIDLRIATHTTNMYTNTTGSGLVARYVRLVGYNHYFTVLRSAKVVLDTYPYGGCLTSHDALVHQVPIVTLPSEYIRGRFTLGLYNNMNMTSLVAQNAMHFNSIVLALLFDDAFWYQQAVQIKHNFAQLVGTNNAKVAQEWADFFVRVIAD